MKRCLCLMLCLLLLPVPSLGQAAWFTEERQEALKTSSIALAGQMEAGSFEQTLALFSPELARQLSGLQLKLGLAQVRLQAGAFESVLGAHAFATDEAGVIDVYLRHSRQTVRLRLPYDEAGRLIGFWIGAAPEAETRKLLGISWEPAATGEHGIDHPVEIGAYKLPGTLVTPADEAIDRGIAVLLLAGSGPNDRDETIGQAGNKPLRDIAAALAEKGISSLRYDKRSLAAPESFSSGVTIEAEVLEDAAAALVFLQSDERSRDSALFLIGHSLGGMLAPRLLSDHPAIQGAVILAGSPRSLWDILYDQNLQALAARQGMSEAQRAEAEAEATRLRDRAKAMTAATREDLFGLPGEYILSLNALNLPEAARALPQPLMILQGEDDLQVSRDKDYAAWQTLLSGKDNVHFGLYPGLNHLFMKSTDGALSDYDLPGHVDGQVTEDIAEWLIARAGGK